MTSTPDELASAGRELALAALREITPASTVGPVAGYTVEESGAVSLRFENRLPGYPGWYWTVSVAQVEDAEPTVLEAELMPGEGALLAPDWVPWDERLADYRAHQAELAEQAAAAGIEAEVSQADGDAGDGGDADLDDVDDLDDADFDEDGSPHLHGGDLDGVDIDELDEDAPDDDDADDDADSDDDDDADSDDDADEDDDTDSDDDSDTEQDAPEEE